MMTTRTLTDTLNPGDYRYQRELRRMALAVKFIKIERAAQALVSA